MRIFVNQRRLRDYPRLFFFTAWTLLLLNLIFHNGWLGAAGQIIGNDFLAFFSGGVLMREASESVYDGEAQMSTQERLVAPTSLWGYIPFINPPYVAAFFSLWTFLPYAAAFALWIGLSLLCLIVASGWISTKILPPELKQKGLSPSQVFMISGSFFAFIEGLLVGQNHGLTLLLFTGVVFCLLHGKSFQAGIFAGFLIYKPQLVFGLLIVWLVWRDWRAALGFGLVSITWVGASLAWRGWNPFQAYLDLIPVLMQSISLKEMGGYLQLTVYSMLLGFFKPQHQPLLFGLNQWLLLAGGLGLGVYAFKLRQADRLMKIPAVMLALLFPLVVTPHAQLHDGVLLIPFFALWAGWNSSRTLLWAMVSVYLAAFFLPFVAYQINFPLLAFIPLGLAMLLIRDIAIYTRRSNERFFRQEVASE